MKRLIIAPLLLMLTSCGYGSEYEAREACQRWRQGGGYFYNSFNKQLFRLDDEPKERTRIGIRFCEKDSTNKILGMTYTGVRSGEEVELDRGLFQLDRKVLKRFPY